MDVLSLLQARREELRLTDAEVSQWAQVLDAEFVHAVLSALLRYEEALAELAAR